MVKIKNFEDYFITEDGNVISFKKYGNKNWRKLKSVKNNSGYLFVCLRNKYGKSFSKSIHRLMAETFISNPDNKPEVGHKDCNPLNNNVNNLYWCYSKENMNHPITLQRISKSGIGRKYSEETKEKISKSLLGNKRNLDKKMSEETKQKMRDSHKRKNNLIFGHKLNS